ncbi:hypothetical protein QN382_17795 [Pseudomonas sp. 10B1]|uniref:hypothetical protein n=1 Tax=unclassified Pseudomonas TaxID=196821 RepID=UPI002AB408A0|nr:MULTISPECIES: hypothetical protein [unclassified Pseudomonas]MDY7562738.1 hypothetical protein [Pseudomonas sp. AB6]MEA9977398.1 hypothetical protein [Pseudomonas sp. RTS4]MEA9996929.1 hypothetical protein [Pseudomonas sp. AA4]MEB0089150.1 hypothetical protein [Pseudomonas sp. RTI1]MEB0128342.1 hypothetical protein [Pseudomonas sp. CCC1.2]
MLHEITSEHFTNLLTTPSTLHLPNGNSLIVMIEAVTLKPQSRLPESPRIPFTVMLHSVEPTTFASGLCALDLAPLGRMEEIFVSREPAMGRDASLGYFNIVFN